MDNQARDKHLWVFNAGFSFSGNPKWLFMYIINHRPDIKPVWLCYDRATLRNVRGLGYKAYMFHSRAGRRVMSRAGVYVVNQAKEEIYPELQTVTMLNLWHGVGCKSIERKVTFGFLNERIAKKYIKNNAFYMNNQLLLVTSPLMEEHFKQQMGIEEDKLIRAGYPCCFSPDKLNSFDHDVRRQKGMPADCKLAVYSPTYRDGSAVDFFGKAIPDMEKLVERLKQLNMLLIFKMHPQMEKDYGYVQMKRLWGDCPNLLFWDNSNDIYEIFSDIDLAVVDYSSIFYDMLAHGVKHFIRYMFDIDNKDNLRDFVFDVKEMTCGTVCDSFAQLLDALGETDDSADADYKRIYDLFWQYADNSSMDDIIEQAMRFEPQTDRQLPTLYSYDIFDTVIKRSCLEPAGIFLYVKQKMLASSVKFPQNMVFDYMRIRQCCEANAREMWYKTMYKREGDHREITFDAIFERMQDVYNLTDEQIGLLKQWELEAEYLSCIPYTEHIDDIKKLLASGERVVLISDMYLPIDFVKKLLKKADPVLAELPLMLSSDVGTQKTTKKLYADTFHSIENYNFARWIHRGDNELADKTRATQMGIISERHEIPHFQEYERLLAGNIGTYDAYCVSGLICRFKQTHSDVNDIYAYGYVSLYLVPYVSWALKDAIKRGLKTVYFISRDGHLLKLIADEIISVKGYDIKTKYIYGSRKAWRVPSLINEIDDEFFGAFGNFAQVKSYKALLSALSMDEQQFDEMLPELNYVKQLDRIKPGQQQAIRTVLSNSTRYREYVLELAAKERGIVIDYLNQEIDFDEPFGFIEYWGRGYTQDCLGRLLDYAAGREVENIFYYMRSICFDDAENHTYRRNFTSRNTSLIFVESIFANIEYRSVTEYKRTGERIEPVIVPCDNDKRFSQALEQYLVRFAHDLYLTPMVDEDALERSLTDFALQYYNDNPIDPVIVNTLGHLKDSVTMYGKTAEFAPPITVGAMFNRLRGMYFETKSPRISMARSNPLFAKMGEMFYSEWRKYPKVRKVLNRLSAIRNNNN